MYMYGEMILFEFVVQSGIPTGLNAMFLSFQGLGLENLFFGYQSWLFFTYLYVDLFFIYLSFIFVCSLELSN